MKKKKPYTEKFNPSSLGRNQSGKGRGICDKVLEQGKIPEGSYEDEYQKIMALHVLYTIGSDKLNEYREKAFVLPYKWLIANAESMNE